MTTVLDLITDALQDAGVLGSNETPNATDGQKAFRMLNRMLDSASTESLMIYQIVYEVFNLTNQTSYSIGPTGNWITTRPTKVVGIYMRDTNGNDLPVQMISEQEYQDILSKPVTATIALCAWVNDGMPNTDIFFYPVPSSTTYRAVIWSWKLLTQFTAISDTVTLPPGYEDYIESNLAVRLCTAFGRSVPPDLQAWAQKAKSNIKYINSTVPLLGFCPELVSGKIGRAHV